MIVVVNFCQYNILLTRFVNVCLDGLTAGNGSKGTFGTILLTNPVGSTMLTYAGLAEEVGLEIMSTC